MDFFTVHQECICTQQPLPPYFKKTHHLPLQDSVVIGILCWQSNIRFAFVFSNTLYLQACFQAFFFLLICQHLLKWQFYYWNKLRFVVFALLNRKQGVNPPCLLFRDSCTVLHEGSTALGLCVCAHLRLNPNIWTSVLPFFYLLFKTV